MTYSEDLMNTTQMGDSTYLDDQPTYPSIFGIDLSPMLIGSLLTAVGVGAAAYLGYTNILPQYQANQEMQTKLANVQQQIQDRRDMAKKITAAEADLKKATEQRESVLAMFANEQKLDTLLLDLNKLISIRQGELQKFAPDVAMTGVVSDSSLGTVLNGKLRRKSTDIEVEGGFEQMQSILRTVERMDQLLVLRDFKADLQAPEVNRGGSSSGSGIPTIKTKFKLQAIIPLTKEEQLAAAPSPSPSAKK
jgi:type IV pilus assembly protein PilO